MIRRPVIAPGLHVLTDPTGDLQLGLTGRHRLRVPDTPGVRRALGYLARGEALPDGRELRRARALLAPALRDGDSLVRPGIAAADLAAVVLQHPHSAAARLDARQRARIGVLGDLGTDPSPLLDAVGLPRADQGTSPTVVLVLSRGEPDRAPIDLLVRTGTAHLVVRAVESEVLVGPFVVPGRTACLRCCDLHREEHDPGYAAQLHELLRTGRTDGVAEPLETTLAWIGLGLAVHDLLRYVEDEQPVAWSSIRRLRLHSGSDDLRTWPPHPDCSCTWAEARVPVERSATMEA
ncbi:MAG: hypothetical protein NTV23_08330 [Propionibacteriales bacterium]|nr:hypothetical protein [Propionibacteriales bacterium]